ncbi:MAG: branched-chain amino acid ABC transporter permease [Thermomicrobiales bacterium]
MTFETLVAIIVSGTVAGSLYALMASGLSLVWGTLRMFNFAHGTLLMLGAYTAWYLSNGRALDLGLATGIPGALIIIAMVGVLLYFLLVRPFLNRPGADLVVIITTLAGASFLQNGAQEVFGPRYKQLDRVVKGQIEIFNTAIGLQETLIIVITPMILLLLAFFLKRTKLGLAIRAVEQNRDSALLAGVNVGRVYPLVFAVSAALAALAGVLLAGLFFITPVMGSDPLLRAFIVVVFGGLGSLPGTVVGAYVIGIIEAIAVFFVGLYWAPVVLFIVLILVMIVRPTGLMGGQE